MLRWCVNTIEALEKIKSQQLQLELEFGADVLVYFIAVVIRRDGIFVLLRCQQSF